MVPLLQLVVRSAGVHMRTFINGVPLGYDDEGGGFYSRIPLNEWLMPSGNRIDVDVAPPATRPERGADIEVSVALPDDEGPPLQRFQWRMTADEEIKPFRVSFPFPLPVKCPTRVWGVADRLETLEGKEKAAAAKLAGEVYAAFAARDAKAIAKLMEFRTHEIALAFQDDPEEDKRNAPVAYGRIVKDPDFKLEPFEAEKLDFQIVANRQLVHVTRAGRPLIDTVPDEEASQATIPIYLARLKDGWVVAR